MVSFADYKKSGALEAKKKAREAGEVTKAQKVAESTTTGTYIGTASPAGNGSPNDSGVDLGSPIVPPDAPVAAAPGTGLANTKPTGSPSIGTRTTKTPMHLRPVFDTVPRAGNFIVKATQAPAWGQSKAITGVAFIKPKLKDDEICKIALPKLPMITAHTKVFEAWAPPRPGSPSYKARVEKVGFKVLKVTRSATFLEISKPPKVTGSTVPPETKQFKSSRYKRDEGHRYADDESIQKMREETKKRELTLWTPNDRHYVANVLKHNDRTFYELVDKYKSASMELLLNKVKIYHLSFDLTSTEYVLMGDEISEIEARKDTNKWDEQNRLDYEQRIRQEEEDERRHPREAEQRARLREEAQTKREATDREKALKVRGRKISPTNDFMKNMVKDNKTAEDRAKTREEERRGIATKSSFNAAMVQSKVGVDLAIKTTAVKKEAVESAKKPSESSTTVKTSTRRKAEKLEPTKQEAVPNARQSLKFSSPHKAGRGVSRSASPPKKVSSASAATEKTSEPPQRKARTQEPVQDSNSLINDTNAPQDGYIHIPPSPSHDNELLIIAGADLDEFAQTPAKVQQKSPERCKLTAKKPRVNKAPKVEEKTQWAESDDEVTDSEDERWQQTFRQKAAEYKARKANSVRDDSDVEIGTARVVRKRKCPSDDDEDSSTSKVDDLSNFIVNTPCYVPARQPKKAKISNSAKDPTPRKADFGKYVAGLW